MRRRQGFTLVELLVAMALIMFIMAILSSAFVAATGTFRNLKAAGDMAEKLRATTQILTRDLAADHFEGKKRLSNPNFWLNGPPEQGFFQVWQGSAPSTAAGSPCFIEGHDLDTIASYHTINHGLAFTIKLRGNQMGDFLSAGAPASVLAASANFGPGEARYQTGASYNYQWAEVAWFMVAQPDTTVADPNGSPAQTLYTLYRRQHLAVPDNNLVTPIPFSAATAATCLELSWWNNSGNFYFNSPIDLTVPSRRFGASVPTSYTTLAQDLTNLGAANTTLAGADIQLTDVVSFDVRMLAVGAPASVDPFATLFDPPFTSYTYTAPTGMPGMVFDTWSSVNDGLSNYSQWNLPAAAQNPAAPGTTIPLWNAATQSGPIIQAIQVSIRIWDAKTNQTRQVTIVQAM